MCFSIPLLSHIHAHTFLWSQITAFPVCLLYFSVLLSFINIDTHTWVFCSPLSCCNLMHLSVWVPPSHTRSCFPKRVWGGFSHENQKSTSICWKLFFCAFSPSLTLLVGLSPSRRFMQSLLYTLLVDACIHVWRQTHMHLFSPKGMFLELISVIEYMFYCLLLDREFAEAEECNSWYR